MESARIASTPLGGLKVLGRAVDRDFVRLTEYLAAHPELGPDCAGLFAEPVPTRDGSRIDWYVAGNVRGVPLESLDVTRQRVILERVLAALSSIRSEGERLRAAEHPMGSVLVNATETPAPLAKYVYVLLTHGDSGVAGTPVIVCWAHSDDAARTPGAAPQVMVAGPPPAPMTADAQLASAPVAAVTAGAFRWWWPLWLLLALLLLVIAWLLLRACGLAVPGLARHGWLYCRPAESILVVETERSRVLDDAARRLQLQIVRDRTACAAATPPPLPKDRWQGKDLSILRGCWSLGKDTQTLVVDDSGKQQRCTVHAGTICFGADGTGTREQTTQCGAQRFSVCKAGIKAHFTDEGALETEQPDTKCAPPTITWIGKQNRLVCKRTDDSGALCRDTDNFEHEFRPKTGP